MTLDYMNASVRVKADLIKNNEIKDKERSSQNINTFKGYCLIRIVNHGG